MERHTKTGSDTEGDDETTGESEETYVKEVFEENEDWSFVGESVEHDLTLIVEEHKIHVSRAVLCLASPVFRAMLQSDFKEKQIQEVELPEKKYEDFAEFLRCIYPDKLKCITGNNVYQILPLVMEYQVKVLQARCQMVLIQIVRQKPGDVFKHIGLAELYKMEDLRKMCVYIASETSVQCIETATVMISAKTLLQIYHLAVKRNNLNRVDDEDLFQNLDIRVLPAQNGIPVWKTVHYKDLIKHYLELHLDPKGMCRQVRLSYRYMPDLLKTNTDIFDKTLRQQKTTVKEVSLLPESVKQSMTITKDMHQHFYPPLPVVPKP